jgi:hypothetical protein
MTNVIREIASQRKCNYSSYSSHPANCESRAEQYWVRSLFLFTLYKLVPGEYFLYRAGLGHATYSPYLLSDEWKKRARLLFSVSPNCVAKETPKNTIPADKKETKNPFRLNKEA